MKTPDIMAINTNNTNVKIAAVQMKLSKDARENVKRIITFLQNANCQLVDIVCFPETCLQPDPTRVVDVSEQIMQIQYASRKYGVWCIFGAYIREGKKISNTTFLVDRSGKIRFRYRKVHLWKSEKGLVAPGKGNRIVQSEFGKIAIITCWDFAFPSFVQNLSKKGARIIFCPSFLIDSHDCSDLLRGLPLVRSFENLAFFVSCDAFSPKTFSESYICHPLRILSGIRKKEGMITARVNLAEIDSLRRRYNHVEEHSPVKEH